MPESLVITGRPNVLAISVTKAPNQLMLCTWTKSTSRLSLNRILAKLKGENRKRAGFELNPLHPMNLNAVDQFDIVLSRVEAAR